MFVVVNRDFISDRVNVFLMFVMLCLMEFLFINWLFKRCVTFVVAFVYIVVFIFNAFSIKFVWNVLVVDLMSFDVSFMLSML